MVEEPENSRLERSTRSQKQLVNESNQRQETEVSLNSSKKLSSTSKKKKKQQLENKVLTNVFHYIENKPDEIKEAIEEYNGNRKSIHQRKSLCKRKLDYQYEDQVVAEEIENTPPQFSHSTVLSISNSANISKNLKNKSLREKSNILSPMQPPKSIQKTLLDNSNSENINKSHRNQSLREKPNKLSPMPPPKSLHKTVLDSSNSENINRSLRSREKSNKLSPMQPPQSTQTPLLNSASKNQRNQSLREKPIESASISPSRASETQALNNSTSTNKSHNMREKEIEPDPMPPPAVPVQMQKKSNSQIVITKLPRNNETISNNQNTRESMSIKIMNDFSPIVSANKSAKLTKNRLIELKNQETTKVFNDDSKDETELMLSQSQKFIKKSSLRQNNTTASTTSRISVGSTPSINNPFQTRHITNSASDDGKSNKKDGKNKRKRSPANKTDKIVESPRLSSTHITSKSINNKNNSRRKRINYSLESDDDDDELKPSPEKKPNLIIINKKKAPEQTTTTVKSKLPVKKGTKNKSIAVEKIPEVEVEIEPVETSKPKTNKQLVEESLRQASPAPIIEEEIKIIPETQPEVHYEQIEAQPSPVIINEKAKKSKTSKKQNQEAERVIEQEKERKKSKEKKQTKIHRIEIENEEVENNNEGVRRSKRTRVQAHANLRPIYELEVFSDEKGNRVALQKCVGFEKINNDLTRFRAAMQMKWSENKKANYIVKNKENRKKHESESEDDKKVKKKTIKPANDNKEKSKKKKYISDDDDEREIEPVIPEAKSKKMKELVVADKISVVVENDEEPIADINNNSDGANFNNESSSEATIPQPVVLDKNNNNSILLSQTYYNLKKSDNINHDNEMLLYDNEESNEPEEAGTTFFFKLFFMPKI